MPPVAPERERATEPAMTPNSVDSIDSVDSFAPTHDVPEDATATPSGAGAKRKRTPSIASTDSDQFWAPCEPDGDKENRRI